MKIALFNDINEFTPNGKINKNSRLGNSLKFKSGPDKFLLNTIIIGIFCLAFYFLLIGRAINVQVVSQQKYLSLAENNRIREFTIFPARGVIKDANGEVVARNKPLFSVELNTLICDSSQITTCKKVIELAKDHIEIKDEDRVLNEIDQKRTNILVAQGVSKENVLSLEANLDLMPGISIETSPFRDYLFPYETAHLLGYVGLGDTLTPTIVGKTGLEEFYNSYLSGVSGTKIVQVDSTGSSYNIIAEQDPLPGKDLTLYLDKDLQVLAYQLLEESILQEDSDAKGGAIVVQNPIDGSVLALVSYPSFDLNKISFGISPSELADLNTNPNFPFFNRAISASYPPGSVFKLITASAVLMENIANPNYTVFDNGYISVGSYVFRNWKLDGHGEVNLVRALQVSNDTYFYTVGGGHFGLRGLGIQNLYKWSTMFGLGEKTGIDLPGEVAGFMPDGTHREWYLGDDFISAIGQGDILATPLQMNNMMTYFANGGYLYVPRVVKEIDGETKIETQLISKDLIDKETYETVRLGVKKAVEPGGTGYPLFDFPAKNNGIILAGKTGTSEYIDRNGEEKTHAWFSAFGPYLEDQSTVTNEDRPIVVTVFIEGGGSGSDDAAPLARKIFDFWFSN